MSATTTNRDYPYPQSSDTFAPAGDIEALAEAVDTDVQTVADLVTLLTPLYVQLDSDASAITGTGLTTVMTFTIPAAGTYVFDGLITLTNTGAVGRPGLGFGGTCVTSAWRWGGQVTHYNSSVVGASVSASGTTAPTSGSQILSLDFTTTTGFSAFQVKGKFTVTSPGTWTVRFCEASGSGTVNVKAGSMMTVQYAGS